MRQVNCVTALLWLGQAQMGLGNRRDRKEQQDFVNRRKTKNAKGNRAKVEGRVKCWAARHRPESLGFSIRARTLHGHHGQSTDGTHGKLKS